MTDSQTRWKNLFKGKDESLLDREFQLLASRYAESHRFYHTMEHVVSSLQHLDDFSDFKNKQLVEIALWFHDVVYEPLKGNNEEKSALFAQKAMERLGFDVKSINRTMELIILTKHPSQPKTLDEQYLIDIDLSILGSNPALYAEYETWIRKEYRYVPWFLYKRGRRKILESFLAQPSIYSSAEFSERYESVARTNLENALFSL